MHEAASGEWISVWLSPLATFLVDVAFATLIFAMISLLFRAVSRIRSKGSPPAT